MAQLLSFGHFIARYLPGKIQKLSINTGHPCPNRDGTLGYGGCIYCANSAFSPAYTATAGSITEQIVAGKEFFARKYPQMKYLAYFQSYTSTNAPFATVRRMISEALEVPAVEGCIVGTRPDCISSDLLQWMASLTPQKFMMVEYGAETAHDRTLRLVNRHHTWSDTVAAAEMAHSYGIPVGLHLIFGLPGENRDDIMATIDAVNSLPVDLLKCHHMQVLRGTELHRRILQGSITLPSFTIDEYITLCRDVLHRLRPDIIVERLLAQAPPSMVISPHWALKNHEFMALLLNGTV